MHVRWHRFHSTHHPRLLPQPWEGNVPSGRHPNPTKRPLLELEVSMCGCRDSWVRVPAYCQSSGRWGNISGIRRGAVCPARRSGARRCWALRSRCLCQVLGPRIGGQAVGPQRGPQASVLALGGLSRRITSELILL